MLGSEGEGHKKGILNGYPFMCRFVLGFDSFEVLMIWFEWLYSWVLAETLKGRPA